MSGGNKGGNKAARQDHKSEDTRRRNEQDEKIHRDPDIRGVGRREARDIHKRGARD